MTERAPLYTIGSVGHWGIWDTVANVWMGTPEGPLTYVDREIARVAAQALNVRFDYGPVRLVTKRYDDSGNRLKDYIDPVMDGLAALRVIEEYHDGSGR